MMIPLTIQSIEFSTCFSFRALLALILFWFGNVGYKGRNKFSAIYAILYVWGIMTLISFLEPLWLLFLILMIQGMISAHISFLNPNINTYQN